MNRRDESGVFRAVDPKRKAPTVTDDEESVKQAEADARRAQLEEVRALFDAPLLPVPAIY